MLGAMIPDMVPSTGKVGETEDAMLTICPFFEQDSPVGKEQEMLPSVN